MCVLSPLLVMHPADIRTMMQELQPDHLFLQDMTSLSSREIAAYKAWLKKEFHLNAFYIDSYNHSVSLSDPFYDLEADELLQELTELFYNQSSEHFRQQIRQHHCVTCRHCSWNCFSE